MKITVNTSMPPERKLVAALSHSGGISFRNTIGYCHYLAPDNKIDIDIITLETRVKKGGWTPVYEGDSITLHF